MAHDLRLSPGNGGQTQSRKRLRNGVLKEIGAKASGKTARNERRENVPGLPVKPAEKGRHKLSQNSGAHTAQQKLSPSSSGSQHHHRSRFQTRDLEHRPQPDKSRVAIARPGVSPASQLVFEPRQDWFNAKLPDAPSGDQVALPDRVAQALLLYGKDLLKEENQCYASKKSSSSSFKFYSTIMSSGTLSDKVSALTLSFQESPLHNMQALESLIGLAKKRSRSQAVQVLGALKDLFSAGSVLPSDRRLHAFAAQPTLWTSSGTRLSSWHAPDPLPPPLTKAQIMIWAFEDWLKAAFFDIIRILEIWCNDEIVFSRLKAVDYTYELLRERPEQEVNLLHLLANKLGDPEKKIASRASYNIVQLQLPHPFMKSNIISTIESDILFRPGQSLHAKYYAVITLNQTVLSGHQQDIVTKILDLYFGLFLLLLDRQTPKAEEQGISTSQSSRNRKVKEPSKKGSVEMSNGPDSSTELKEKLISAILTGINRAFPFAGSNDEFFERHFDTLFRITHSSNFNTSLQALMLIQQLCSLHTPAADRFYRTLYESLLDPRLFSTSKQTLYVNLLFRALKADLDVKRVQAFVKRITQTVAMHQPPFACAAIYLIKQLGHTFPSLQTLFDQPETIDNDSENEARDTPNGPSNMPVRGQDYPHIYDGRKRDPRYSNADRTCLWEMDLLLRHFHPSASLFASKLLESSEEISAKPELSMHSLISFLDRFVHRNPKKPATSLRGASVMQPHAIVAGVDLLVSAQGQNRKIPLSSASLNKDPLKRVEAAPDEVFFHHYFDTRSKGKDKSRKFSLKRHEPSSTTDDLTQEPLEDEEDAIWKALVDSRPDIEGNSEDDLGLDDDLSDLESAMQDYDEEAEKLSDSQGSISDEGSEDTGIVDDSDEVEYGDGEVQAGLVQESSILRPVKANERDPKMARKRRKMLRGLPTFASAEDYAQELLEGDEEEVFDE